MMYKILLLLVLGMLVLAGCQPTPETDTTNTFSSEQELLAYLSGAQGDSRNLMNVPTRQLAVAEVAVDSSAGASSRDFSETNVQVAGIDEADIIKTDGEFIYTISGNTLFVIRAYPGEDAHIVSRVSFNQSPQELFIFQDRLVVFGSSYDFRSVSSYAKLFDISDKTAPQKINEFVFDGGYFRSRMIDGDIFLVTTQWPDIAHPMPFLRVDGVESTMPLHRIFYYPSNNPMYVSVHSFSMVNPEIESVAILVERTEQLYMSENAIYISYTEYINEYSIQQDVLVEIIHPRLSSEERDLIRRIEQTDNDILSASEKRWKIQEVYQAHAYSLPTSEMDDLEKAIATRVKEILDSYDAFEFTHIYKVSLDTLEPVATGKVPGRIINQFALDEHEGILRIATTTGGRWMNRGQVVSANHVYALNENLDIIGRLEGLAETESIFAARFIENRLYMVTFEIIDPFFVIDLTDPTNIVNLGELKIPGFSRYLHPYSDNIIMGIGHEADDLGRITGLKISLFDVSDVHNPIELTNYITDQRHAHSTALFEHRAFLFSKEKNLLVIPVVSYERNSHYSGAFVFYVDDSSIELRGLIEHSSQVERSLYIEELLYTKSHNMLRINLIDTLARVSDIPLTQAREIPIY